MENTLQFTQPQMATATDAEIVAYLRRSYQIAEIADKVEAEALILATCSRLGIAVSDDELQVAGDAFRLEHKLLGTTETLAWLQQQRMSVEDWSSGIRHTLLRNKLREHLFGAVVDAHYVSSRDNYRRVALSQILVLDVTEAWQIAQSLREENASFCALALQHSKGKHSQENGGFAGIHFLVELMPEIAQAIAPAQADEIIGPIQTKLGYHIVRIEKLFPTELNEPVREKVLESLFHSWLQEQSNSNDLT